MICEIFFIKLFWYLVFEVVNILIIFVWFMLTIVRLSDPELKRNPSKYDNVPSLRQMLNEHYSLYF